MAEWRDPDVMARIGAILDESRSWMEAKRALKAAHDRVLDAAAWHAALEAWQDRAVRRLADRDLGEELRHWAEGGRYQDHLQGFDALPPRLLVKEAKRRHWFTRGLASGGAVVNPPGGRPLSLPPSPV